MDDRCASQPVKLDIVFLSCEKHLIFIFKERLIIYQPVRVSTLAKIFSTFSFDYLHHDIWNRHMRNCTYLDASHILNSYLFFE